MGSRPLRLGHKLPLTALIHENFSIIIEHAFARPQLRRWLPKWFSGEWKLLYQACFEISELRANRALLELATQIRLLDDAENISGYLRMTSSQLRFGKLIKMGGTEEELYLRDMTNKILHSAGFEWRFDDEEDPILVCHSKEPERWDRAEISIRALAVFCDHLV